MDNKIKRTSDHNRYLIREAIRKIALGRSLERIDMAPGGTHGIGTARLIHGYVSKIHSDPGDEEFKVYGGTVDVTEYPDETASSECITYKGILLAGTQHNEGGFLVIPSLFSDVTIVTDAATRYGYLVNYSHADVIQLQAHTETRIGVQETETLNTEDENSGDYDELEATGNESFSYYTAQGITTTVKNKDGKEALLTMEAESIVQKVDEAEIEHSKDKIVQQVSSMNLAISADQITLGDENATEPVVLGNELADLILDFIDACEQVKIPTMLGTMVPLNLPSFIALKAKVQAYKASTSGFLSKKIKTV